LSDIKRVGSDACGGKLATPNPMHLMS
jgi:hypothetical protein